MPASLRRNDVFLNCPFDAAYKPIFDAIVFCIADLSFQIRCAMELDDGGEVRLDKIGRIIEECQFGVHDISNVALDTATGLPRFNMPLELGMFLGCKRFGTARQRQKACLILDREPYRYREFISDISGQDVHAHGGDPLRAISEVRDWLATASRRKGLPGGAEIGGRYVRFRNDLPPLCKTLRREADRLTFADLSEMIEIWLKTNR